MNYRQKVGKFGETLARDYLRRHGYEIIKTNLKVSYKEIDIIACRGRFVVFIEVKTRTSSAYGSADENLDSKKIDNLKKALNHYFYLNDNKLFNQEIDLNYVRIDLIAVDINRRKKIAKIKHYKDVAW
ncbi:endonuclease [Candidatus Falkowbacteria bacterium CG11_big_fil_rev_8_21_14_0_20_39_10]|uniref:UPF0102 protein COV49_04180 n=1 Tax=Candidatus Falkowbacteria bacterium CG11_big_fil_rev_8_21_14_0_20_39_10 TaxID=1974570 RepID=A0A2M6K820_9BACT|nr:MAG: endonuclease [Candidatus Falkowbacteria bacterium CG11_big_fil_rev_8_21_14_0_20_39_10]